MFGEGLLDKRHRFGTEQDFPGLFGLGLEQAPDEVVDCDVLVLLVRFDVHVVEAAAPLRHPSDSSHAL